jgi:hypothetical protein
MQPEGTAKLGEPRTAHFRLPRPSVCACLKGQTHEPHYQSKFALTLAELVEGCHVSAAGRYFHASDTIPLVAVRVPSRL